MRINSIDTRYGKLNLNKSRNKNNNNLKKTDFSAPYIQNASKINVENLLGYSNINFTSKENFGEVVDVNLCFPLKMGNEEAYGIMVDDICKNYNEALILNKEIGEQIFFNKDGKFSNDSYRTFINTLRTQFKKEFYRIHSLINYIAPFSVASGKITLSDIQNLFDYEEFSEFSLDNIPVYQMPPLVNTGHKNLDSIDNSIRENSMEFLALQKLENMKQGKEKFYFATALLKDLNQKFFSVLEKKSIDKTIFLLSLSKTDDGFDLSDMDKKEKLIDQYSSIDNDNALNIDIVNRISKEVRGKTDLEFLKYFKYLYALSVPSEEIWIKSAKVLSYFMDLNLSDMANTTEKIIDLSRYTLGINDALKEILAYAYTPDEHKFDENAYSQIRNLARLILNMTVKNEESPNVKMVNQKQLGIIKQYFENIKRDKDGYIIPPNVSMSDFVEEHYSEN